jgi:hypothetical protein
VGFQPAKAGRILFTAMQRKRQVPQENAQSLVKIKANLEKQ